MGRVPYSVYRSRNRKAYPYRRRTRGYIKYNRSRYNGPQSQNVLAQQSRRRMALAKRRFTTGAGNRISQQDSSYELPLHSLSHYVGFIDKVFQLGTAGGTALGGTDIEGLAHNTPPFCNFSPQRS